MSGEEQFLKTFTSKKKATKPANNLNKKREKARAKEKHLEVESQVQKEDNANVQQALPGPSSSADSHGGGDDDDRQVPRELIANGGAASSSLSRSVTKKRKSDDGGAVGRKHKSHKEDRQTPHGKQGKEEPKMKPNQEVKKQTGKGEKAEQQKMKKEKKKKDLKVEEEEDVTAGCRFPVARVDRIIRSEASDCRITNEAVFLINKASEKFLEILCGDSYNYAAHDHKKYVSYNHLATAVSKAKRLDFLSDYVPEKVRAEKALAERPLPPVEK